MKKKETHGGSIALQLIRIFVGKRQAVRKQAGGYAQPRFGPDVFTSCVAEFIRACDIIDMQ